MADERPPRPANQRESFPKFDIIAARAAMDRTPASLCMFSLRERVIGQLFIYKMLENSIIVNYLFSDEHIGHAEKQDLFRTKVVDNSIIGQRRLLECPSCQQHYWALRYKDHWACADCLKLHYRSQLVDKAARLWERRDFLHARLRYGRPRGMHNRTHMKLREELLVLEATLKGKSRTFSSEAHDQIVSSTWVPAKSVDLWFPGFTVRAGQFVRLP
jgi:protein-arginine kinase activator protein McsA